MNATPDLLTPQRPDREVPASPNQGRSSGDMKSLPPEKAPRLGRLLFFVLLILAVGLVFGLVPRLRGRQQVAADTTALAQPTVSVVHPVPAKASAPLVLSGELRPEAEASIHARVNGYIRKWYVDLGAKVEAGQLLAELDTPDTDRELSQARAQLVQAEAARDLAGTTAKRWKEMLQAKTVSSQEADEKASDYELKKATVEGAKANVQRLEQVTGFARITAPFAGTITLRSVDVGELITAGEGQELFRLAQTDKLRVFVRIPQNYARSAVPGQIAKLSVAEISDRKIDAKVVRTAGALDPATRTLLTELEVDNAKGEILAGSYGRVELPDIKPEPVLTIPANTLLFRAEGTQVAVVVQGKVNLRTVALGRDFGSSVEVRDGVGPDDLIIVNPGDALTEGSVVQAVEAK